MCRYVSDICVCVDDAPCFYPYFLVILLHNGSADLLGGDQRPRYGRHVSFGGEAKGQSPGLLAASS